MMYQKSVILLAVISLFMACNSSKQLNVTKTYNPVVAHRGAFKKNGFPENSIASLKEAIRLGCAGSEFDVRMTKDEVLVINHDPHFKGLAIETTDYAELVKLPLSNGETIPTLKEYITAGLQNNPHTTLVCEIKPSEVSKARGQLVAEKTVRMIHELHAEAKTVYISFDYDILKKVLATDARAHVQYLNGDKSPAEIKKDGMAGLDYHYSVFQKNPGWIPQARQLGLVLNGWTVNDSTLMDWLIKEKFDYITTNEPELLLQQLKQ